MAATKTGKKRAAPSQSDIPHKKKKIIESKLPKAAAKRPKPAAVEKKAAIRKKPITAPIRNESDSEEEDASESEGKEFGDLGNEMEAEEEQEVEDEMNIAEPKDSRNGPNSEYSLKLSVQYSYNLRVFRCKRVAQGAKSFAAGAPSCKTAFRFARRRESTVV